MARIWIVVGDMTDSGGCVVTGSPFTDIDGKPVARIGDQATCPKHKGAFAIVDGDQTTIIDGKPVALHGSSLACGCKLLAVQQQHVFNDQGAATGSTAKAVAAMAPALASSTASATGFASTGTAPAPEFADYTLFYHYGDLDQTPVRGVSYQAMLADDSVRTGTLDDNGQASLGWVTIGPVQLIYQHESDDGDDGEILAARSRIQEALDAIVAQTREDFAGEWRQWEKAGSVQRGLLKFGNQALGNLQGTWDYVAGTVDTVCQFAVLMYKADSEIREWEILLLRGDRAGLDRKIADYRAQGRQVMDAASEMKELFNLLIDDPAILTLLPDFVEDWWEAIPPDERENLKARYSSQIILDVIVSVILAAVTIEAGGAGGLGYAAAKAGTTAARVGAKLLKLLEKVEDAFKALARALRKRKRRMREGQRTPDADKQVETVWTPKRMREKKLPCFSPQKLPASKYVEMDRQLAGQAQGLNDMTVQEYLDGRKAFQAGGARDPKVARDAREKYAAQLEEVKQAEFEEAGYLSVEAEKLAASEVAKMMKTMHALHNPDLVAGGLDKISGFGDGDVNSTIGREWVRKNKDSPSKIDVLDEAVMQVPEAERAGTKMNSRMERCK